jgi:hypothetical protein
LIQIRQDFEVTKLWHLWPNRELNPLTRNPRKYYSQSDEDGILEKILIRLGQSKPGSIIEFGVGDGTENNSLALISRGWSSYWVGGEDLAFDFPLSQKHFFKKIWVTLDNILEITTEALFQLQTESIDIVSLDFDGNDFHFIKKLLEEGLQPKIWVCEYNAKFPPGSKWKMPYDASHIWKGDDYFGASFSAFTEIMKKYEYFPVACSVQGANIFFVKEQYRHNFQDIPLHEEDLYQPPFYQHINKWGHKTSIRTLERIFQLEEIV